MAIYAIADLHLSLDERVDKPMDIYGGSWINHVEKLEENWKKIIKEDDTVIIAGDISWGLKLDEAIADLQFISSLPGKKIISKGNHDLWWAGIGKLNGLFDNIQFLHNNTIKVGDISICGTRGWNCPGNDDFTENDLKIYKREILRLKMSIDMAKKDGSTDIIGVLHYPPTNDKKQPSDFTKLFEAEGIKQVVFGHLHGENAKKENNDYIYNGVSYKLISLDRLDCKPVKLR
ncbi:MAG: metallophosphoesterase [Anaerovoracaceae bacterium]